MADHPKGNCISIADLDWDNKKLIGGKFGGVYRTVWSTCDEDGKEAKFTTVAVKSPEGTTKDAIFAERDIKSELSHANILNLLGFAQLNLDDDKVALVFEYTDGSTAMDYILEMRNKGGAKVESMIRIAFDIAKGMEYLHDNSYVHGDLALRNCMMTAGGGMVKVGDLGFYEDRNEKCYFMESNPSLRCPVRWMAPEDLPYKYSDPPQMVRKPFTKSCGGDVWAFGVVLFEIWSRGEYPFKGCDNDQLVCKHVLDGQTVATWNSRFTIRFKINKLMKRCLEFVPNYRGNFKSIVCVFENLEYDSDDSSEYDSDYEDYYLNDCYSPDSD